RGHHPVALVAGRKRGRPRVDRGVGEPDGRVERDPALGPGVAEERLQVGGPALLRVWRRLAAQRAVGEEPPKIVGRDPAERRVGPGTGPATQGPAAGPGRVPPAPGPRPAEA